MMDTKQPMPAAILTSKGRITLPKEIRKKLRLLRGEMVDFHIASNGRVELWPMNRKVREGYGLLFQKNRKLGPPEDISEILAHDDERIKRGL
jgi:AbrB family looped-hinge helix DNA binding protein